MRRTLPFLLILTGIAASLHTDAEVPFNGKSGVALRNSLYENFKPGRTVNTREISSEIYDPFSGVVVRVSGGMLPEGYSWGGLVPAEWWSYAPELMEASMADLFNLFPLHKDVVTYRKELTPGDVTEAIFDNGRWKAGTGMMYGTLTELYSPPEEFRGELARVYFYMALMYPSMIWSPRGFMMMDANVYPVFNVYARQLLMGWHKLYPVSDAERSKNDAVERQQMNRNPFVDFPELADYLWGDLAGEIYLVPGEPVPLRAVYSLNDERIDLISPYIAPDAVWSIDGLPASGGTYTPAELGVGKHHLAYTSPSTGVKGYIMITINR